MEEGKNTISKETEKLKEKNRIVDKGLMDLHRREQRKKRKNIQRYRQELEDMFLIGKQSKRNEKKNWGRLKWRNMKIIPIKYVGF